MWSFQSWQEGIKDIYRVHKQKHKIKSDEVLYKYEKLEFHYLLYAQCSCWFCFLINLEKSTVSRLFGVLILKPSIVQTPFNKVKRILFPSRPILRVYYTYEVTAPMLRQKYDPNGHANNWIRISKISGIIAIKSVLSRKVARKAVAANMLFLTSVSVILIHPIIYFCTPRYTLVWHKLHLMHPY